MAVPEQRLPSDVVDTKILGEPLTLPVSGLIAKSHFMKAALSEQLSSWDSTDLSKRGIPSHELIHLYEEWGKGGFGILLSGNVIVHPEHLETAGNAVIHRPFETPERIDAFKRMAKTGKQEGSLFMMQLSHGGRQVSDLINSHPVSASDIQLIIKDETGKEQGAHGKPKTLTKEEIENIIDQFAYAAEFAYKSGFDGIQLHGAHGYLLAQFLSQTTNKRTDEYGGSVHNRARIIYRIIEEVKRRVTDTKFSVGIKLNSVEFKQGGFQPEECREVCQKLEEMGLDFIELSGGTYEQHGFVHKEKSTKAREAFFIEFAATIRPSIKRATIYITGGFRTAGAMVKAIESGATDGIGLGRPICEEPQLPRMIISGSVNASRDSLIDKMVMDIRGSLAFAGAQLGQIARGDTHLNSTDEKDVKKFLDALGKFGARQAEMNELGVIEPGHVHV